MNKDIFKFEYIKNAKFSENLQFPIFEPCKIVPTDVLAFNYAMTCKNKEKFFVHFYIDDYQFERVWNYPDKYTSILSKFAGIIAPDFSTYTNMPIAQQIFQVYKSRLLAYYWQSLGFNVIPNLSWSTLDSLDWSLEGIPKHSIVALSTNGVLNKKTKTQFIECYKKAIKILEPKKVIIIGEVPTEIQSDNIIAFENNILNRLRNLQRKV